MTTSKIKLVSLAFILFIVSFIILFHWSIHVSSAAPAPGWKAEANLLYSTSGEAAVTGSDGTIYQLKFRSGIDMDRLKFSAYSPTTNTWSEKADLMEGRMEGKALVSSGGKIYAIGGYSYVTGLDHTSVYEYDPDSDTWTQLSESLPVGLRNVTAVASNDGTIYVTGSSYNEYMLSPRLYSIKIGVSPWTEITSLPAGIYNWTMVNGSDGNIYMLNADNYVNNNVLWAYSPSSGTWTQKASMPGPLNALKYSTAQSSNGLIYVIGGSAAGVLSSIVHVYNPVTNSWSMDASFPDAMASVAVTMGTNGLLYGVGGVSSSGYVINTLYSLNPGPAGLSHHTVTSSSWTQTWSAVTGASGYDVYVGGVKVSGATLITGLTYDVTGQTAGTTYSVTVIAVNASGEGPASNADSVTTIPSAPTGLAHTSITSTGWTQTWSAVTGASGYNVYVGGTKVNGATPITGLTYDVTGQASGTTLSVTVRAVNGSGEGADSNADSVLTAPAAPMGLASSAYTTTGWTQTWSAVTGASGYNVYVGGVKVNGVTPITGLTYDVTGQTAGTTYSVTVIAVNASGEGPASNADSVTTIPSAPTGLAHTSITSTGWTQTWSAVTGASGYNVYVDGTKVNGASPINGTTYNVTSHNPSTTYSVTVRAVNGSGESAASSTDSVTTAIFVSSNTDLSGLTLSSGTLSPSFATSTISYTSQLANSVPSITVTASVYDNNSSVTASVYGSNNVLVFGPINLTSGEVSDSLPLSVGSNRIALTITAEDGTHITYSVNVTRASATPPTEPTEPTEPNEPNVPAAPPTMSVETIQLELIGALNLTS